MNRLTLPAIALLVAASPLAALAQEATPTPAPAAPSLDIEAMTCRYLLTAGGDERDLLLAFFHGYFAGKAGPDAVHDVDKMAERTDAVLEWCVDNPSATLVRAFTQAEAAD